MNYFSLAVALTRAEAAPTLAKVAAKQSALCAIKNRSAEVCRCSAYNFPHRSGSGDCPANTGGYDLTDVNADELALFDAAEARAINGSR